VELYICFSRVDTRGCSWTREDGSGDLVHAVGCILNLDMNAVIYDNLLVNS
jgi:hypothetical protein